MSWEGEHEVYDCVVAVEVFRPSPQPVYLPLDHGIPANDGLLGEELADEGSAEPVRLVVWGSGC